LEKVQKSSKKFGKSSVKFGNRVEKESTEILEILEIVLF
jgi:hypothetical protein